MSSLLTVKAIWQSAHQGLTSAALCAVTTQPSMGRDYRFGNSERPADVGSKRES